MSSSSPFAAFRRLLPALLAAWAVAVPAVAQADPLASAGSVTECSQPDERGIQRCRTGLATERLAALVRTQQESQWCWAASIEMLFAAEGFEMEQQAVVREQFAGQLPDVALPIGDMTRLLNRAWTDRNGRSFVASAEATEFGGDLRRTTRQVLAELQAGRPLILGARAHAVVLAQVEFEKFTREDAVRITGGMVLDPAAGQGVRHMAFYEMKPFYVAQVRIEASTEPVAGVSPAVMAAAGSGTSVAGVTAIPRPVKVTRP